LGGSIMLFLGGDIGSTHLVLSATAHVLAVLSKPPWIVWLTAIVAVTCILQVVLHWLTGWQVVRVTCNLH
jgi:apolipoprotein N-acyltransferase